MQELTILYFVYLAWGCGRVGGKVSILDVARWMRLSKPTMKKVLDKMVDSGLLGREIKWKNGREYQWNYWLTAAGQEHLDSHAEEAYAAYRIQVARTIAAIQASNNPVEIQPTSKKNQRQESAGQKRMF